MNWYLAKLIFSINPDNERVKSEFDEQFRLIKATDPSSAHIKARAIGMKEEELGKKEKVNWLFVDVAEIIQLQELSDGMEIYSNTLEISEKENFINSVRLKSLAIQSKSLLLC